MNDEDDFRRDLEARSDKYDAAARDALDRVDAARKAKDFHKAIREIDFSLGKTLTWKRALSALRDGSARSASLEALLVSIEDQVLAFEAELGRLRQETAMHAATDHVLVANAPKVSRSEALAAQRERSDALGAQQKKDDEARKEREKEAGKQRLEDHNTILKRQAEIAKLVANRTR